MKAASAIRWVVGVASMLAALSPTVLGNRKVSVPGQHGVMILEDGLPAGYQGSLKHEGGSFTADSEGRTIEELLVVDDDKMEFVVHLTKYKFYKAGPIRPESPLGENTVTGGVFPTEDSQLNHEVYFPISLQFGNEPVIILIYTYFFNDGEDTVVNVNWDPEERDSDKQHLIQIGQIRAALTSPKFVIYKNGTVHISDGSGADCGSTVLSLNSQQVAADGTQFFKVAISGFQKFADFKVEFEPGKVATKNFKDFVPPISRPNVGKRRVKRCAAVASAVDGKKWSVSMLFILFIRSLLL